jgi:hypothetical protein
MQISTENNKAILNTNRMDSSAGGTLLPSSPSSETASERQADRPPRVITTKPQLPIGDQELRARIQLSHKASSHFQLAYDRDAFADKQAANLLETLEITYSLIFHFTHESFTDRFQVYALDQRAISLLGRSVKPHFNLQERAIYLVESSSQHLHSELIKLLTHAMRIVRYARHYDQTPGWAILEEGFSIFLSERLSMQPDVFPFYGVGTDIIAHHLYHTYGEKLQDIWNLPPHNVAIDKLVLVGAFMLYLGDTFSDDRVVSFSKSDYAITNDTFRSFFGRSLDDLEAAWLQHLPTALISLTEVEQEATIQRWDRAIECKRH